jgi:hypothetical protein
VAPVACRDGYDAWGGPEADDCAGDRDPIDDERSDAWGNPSPVTPPMPPATPPEQQVLPRLVAAAVVGLKAAAWWLATHRLRRVPGRVSGQFSSVLRRCSQTRSRDAQPFDP